MKAHDILNAASNLLGVALLIVTFVHVTGNAARTYTDELAFSAGVLLLGTCILSQRAIGASHDGLERAADIMFLVAQFLLLGAVVCFWF